VAGWDDGADVIVVGSGCAGACAAIEAARAGVSVMLLERTSGFGGTSALSGGALYLGGGTAVQAACGFPDTPEDMFSFLVAAMGPGADERRIEEYAAGSVAHFDWLVDAGVPFKPSFWAEPTWTPPTEDGLMWMGENSHPFRELARPAPRGHRPAAAGHRGWLLMEVLTTAVAAAGVRTVGDTLVERLVWDPSAGVVGVVARRFGEEVVLRAGHGVVLAAGGFIANNDMLAQFAPRLLDHSKVGTDNDDGRAIRMAQAVGAATKRLETAQASINFPPALMARGIVVNGSAARFINEDTYPGRVGQHALFHQGGRAFLVFDEQGYEEVAEDLRMGRIPQWTCETVAELEAEMGFPERALQATVEVYNFHAERGEDPLFHKQAKWVRPLRGAVGAMDVAARRAHTNDGALDQGTGFRVFTLGGVHTTVQGEVLDREGDVIDGLYAAGRTSSGIHGWGYISGTSLGDGTFFGRRAGRAAARHVR